MFSCTLRAFRHGDAAKVNELALAAFDQFRSQYSNWPAMASAIGRMSALADHRRDNRTLLESPHKSYRAQPYNKIWLAQLRLSLPFDEDLYTRSGTL